MLSIRGSLTVLFCMLGVGLLLLNPLPSLAKSSDNSGVFAPPLGLITNNLEIILVPNVGFSWQTVSLDNTYTNPVPICTYVLPSAADNPVAIRIRNLTQTSFEVKIQQPPNSSAVTPGDVYCLVAEEGLHSLADGRTFEAHTVVSTNISGNNAGGWGNGEDVSADVLGAYANPAVLGQVISYNNTDFSVFWSYDCDSRSNPPFASGMADGICVGRHVGELPGGGVVLTRNTENLGYIVVEGDPDGVGGANPVGNLTTGVRYEVALGSDSIDGPDNGGGASYSLANSGYAIGLATLSAMDGNNGGWGVLYGASPLAGAQIDLAIDEDTLGDTERSHTTEQVAYWVFESDPGLPWMESFLVNNVSSAWQTVSLTNDYTNMVPVCTYNLPSAIHNEAVVRIQNINNTTDSFQIRIQRPRNSSSVTASDVHCVVIDEGIHTINDTNPALDRTVEAGIVASDQFNENNNWNASRMENVGYSNPYNQPVVFGQVITYNDSDFSVFWSSNGTATNPPDGANLYVGKHVGEDPGSTIVNDEVLGYLIVEGGSGFSNGFFYQAGLGSDTIAGVGDSPPYSYSLSRNYTYGIATKEAEDGGQGGWAVLYGGDPFAGNQIDLAIDEEIAAGDTTRTHTQEEVAYWVFDPILGGTIWEDPDVDGDLELLEPRLNNVIAWLCPDTHTMPPSMPNCQSTTTDINGDYYFRNLASGDYYLAVDDPNPAQSSTWGGNHDPSINDQIDDGEPYAGGYTISQDFSYNQGDGSTYFDFGYADIADIGGTVWDDSNADGNLDGGEGGFNGAAVWLCPDSHTMPPASPTCLSTFTNGTGDYYFRNITSGDYYFAVADPSPAHISTLGGNHDPSANDQIDDGEPFSGGGFVTSQTFSYSSTVSSTSFDFGYTQYAEIGGTVWDDSDGDGIQNGIISGLTNVSIELFNSGSISQGTTLTPANGTYLFSPLIAGDYYLHFDLLAGYIFTPQDQGGDDTLDSDPDRISGDTIIFSISPGTSDTTWDAGMYQSSSRIFDPPRGLKYVNNSGWPVLVWTQVWINDSNIAANEVEINDPIPVDASYLALSLTCTARGSSVTTNCSYDGVNEQIVWEGTIGPDPGATNESDAANEVVISFQTTIGAGITQTSNQSTAFWDENGDGIISPLDQNVLADTPAISDDPLTPAPFDPTAAVIPRSQLPETGFPPDSRLIIPLQTTADSYTSTGIQLIIPLLDFNRNVVGVQFKQGTWNTSWLGSQAGYLEGTAFPTHPGNTVITAHVWDSNNQPGPFSDLKNLKYGDRVLIKAWGNIYSYLVQENLLISPAKSELVFQHEDYDWLSLLTCEKWDESLGKYTKRRLVRAVLISVHPE